MGKRSGVQQFGRRDGGRWEGGQGEGKLPSGIAVRFGKGSGRSIRYSVEVVLKSGHESSLVFRVQALRCRIP